MASPAPSAPQRNDEMSVTESPAVVSSGPSRRSTSCDLCHKRKVACSMGQPCDACRKYAVHTLGTDPDKMVCVYPCAPAELAKRRASYDDRLLAKQVEEQLEGPQKRRTRSATALETSLDAGECVQVVPERVAEGAEGSPSSVEVKKVKLAKVKQPKVAPEVVKRPEAQVNTSISMHPMSLEAATASVHQPMQYPTFPHTPYVYPTPMHSTYMPHHYYAMPMPDSQPTPPPLFASDAHPPSAHVTLFGAGTSFQSPISSESPFDTLAYRNFSDLESDSAFGGGGSGSGSSFDDTTPPTAALGTSSPFAEYISMVDEGYFPVWE